MEIRAQCLQLLQGQAFHDTVPITVFSGTKSGTATTKQPLKTTQSIASQSKSTSAHAKSASHAPPGGGGEDPPKQNPLEPSDDGWVVQRTKKVKAKKTLHTQGEVTIEDLEPDVLPQPPLVMSTELIVQDSSLNGETNRSTLIDEAESYLQIQIDHTTSRKRSNTDDTGALPPWRLT
jgi:hypothetical protein